MGSYIALDLESRRRSRDGASNDHVDDNGAWGPKTVDVANYDRRWWILAVLGVAQLMVILDSTIVNIALPTAQNDLHFSNADRQWIVTAYSLAFGSLLLLGGRIGDMVGRKRALIIGLVGFAVASAIGGSSVNFTMLVIARTVQGAFGALLAPSVLALLTTTFTDPDERGRPSGSTEPSPAQGGRWDSYSVASSPPTRRGGGRSSSTSCLRPPPSRRPVWLNDQGADHEPFDLPGLFLVGGGLFSLVFGFSHAETTGMERSLHDRVPRGGSHLACCVSPISRPGRSIRCSRLGSCSTGRGADRCW